MPFAFPASSPVFSMVLDTQSPLSEYLPVVISLFSPDPVAVELVPLIPLSGQVQWWLEERQLTQSLKSSSSEGQIG